MVHIKVLNKEQWLNHEIIKKLHLHINLYQIYLFEKITQIKTDIKEFPDGKIIVLITCIFTDHTDDDRCVYKLETYVRNDKLHGSYVLRAIEQYELVLLSTYYIDDVVDQYSYHLSAPGSGIHLTINNYRKNRVVATYHTIFRKDWDHLSQVYEYMPFLNHENSWDIRKKLLSDIINGLYSDKIRVYISNERLYEKNSKILYDHGYDGKKKVKNVMLWELYDNGFLYLIWTPNSGTQYFLSNKSDPDEFSNEDKEIKTFGVSYASAARGALNHAITIKSLTDKLKYYIS